MDELLRTVIALSERVDAERESHQDNAPWFDPRYTAPRHLSEVLLWIGPQEQAFQAYLAALSAEQLQYLLAVMYVGRGDGDLRTLLRQMRASFRSPEAAVAQLIEKRGVGSLLQAGLEMLEASRQGSAA